MSSSKRPGDFLEHEDSKRQRRDEPIVVDPRIDVLYMQALFAVDEYYLENGYVSGKSYAIRINREKLQIQLKHSIKLVERGCKTIDLKRKATRTEGERCEVCLVSSTAGHGVYGTAYRSIATLIFTPDDQIIYKLKSKRLVKIFSSKVNEAAIQKEYRMGLVADHLGVKPPIGDALVMDYFPEQHLGKVIDADRHNYIRLTLKERFMYTIALCDVVDQQMTAKGIIHGDLKPENIREYQCENKIILNIIDMGIARLSCDTSPVQNTGTCLYIAPEVYYEKSISSKCHSWALARMIAEFFRFNTDQIQELEEIESDFNIGMQFNGIYEDLPELEDKYRQKINECLYWLSERDPEIRDSERTAKNKFMAIYKEIEDEFVAELMEELNKVDLVLSRDKQRYFNQFTADDVSLITRRFALRKMIKAIRDEVAVTFTADEIKVFERDELAVLLKKYQEMGMLPQAYGDAKGALEKDGEDDPFELSNCHGLLAVGGR